MKIQTVLLGAALYASAATGFAQQQTSVTIDGQAISVKYTPPAAKKRLMASLHTPADLAFKGVRVPKGDYTVYVLIEGAQWQIAVNKATGAKAATYDAKLDLGRVNMTMGKGAPAPVCKVTLTKIAALAAKFEVASNDVVAFANFHLDRGANDKEW
jgi:hypothetical protein